MVTSYVVFTILLIIVYNFLWTGNCRMGCRPNTFVEDDGLSGLSGLVVPLMETEDTASDCVCESCPCEFIENIIKACGPATRMYNNATDTASQYMSCAWQKCYDAYNRMARIAECCTSCRRHAQLVNSRSNLDSNENFTITEKPEPLKSSKEDSPPKPSVSGATKYYGTELAQTLSDLANKIKLCAKKSDKPSTSPPMSLDSETGYSISSTGSKSSTQPKERRNNKKSKDPDTTTSSKGPKEKQKKSKKIQNLSATSVLENCSKCSEQGQFCVGGCPSAEEKRRKNKK